MGMQELRKYRASCDNCRKIGGEWSEQQEADKYMALPGGWVLMQLDSWKMLVKDDTFTGKDNPVLVICDTCMNQHASGIQRRAQERKG